MRFCYLSATPPFTSPRVLPPKSLRGKSSGASHREAFPVLFSCPDGLTPRLDRRPWRFTPWRSSRSTRPNSSKLFRALDESGPEHSAFKDLRSVTNLALRATKMTAQAIGRTMASLVVLE
ncbi:hypothetical protein Q8A67_010432 [Cirrhinus molitorella]|uniref:Uncharacterized protein n=1 Tax=Cirrhinus molitorella TaxID=172907 RepID=A0AA88PSE8_9TELE|nr:hypothetical protein Q8A67_010432 [Cirrhinus molitorella]